MISGEELANEMAEHDQRLRYASVPWLFYVFNAFNAWILFLIVILLLGRYH